MNNKTNKNKGLGRGLSSLIADVSGLAGGESRMSRTLLFGVNIDNTIADTWPSFAENNKSTNDRLFALKAFPMHG